ncbi:MAG: glycosyltransferase family A protein [Firmicutes bacterium]|nr:glycosyltransferase family A protein [Bacillota bacterium]
MSQELVSVVIPAYNARETIGPTLQSVQNQSYALIETIVVDDGSQDGTAQWIREHYPFVRVERVENGGPSQARNIGWRLSKGQWVAFLDADDIWHPRKLEIQLQAAAVDDRIGLVAADWVRFEPFPDIPLRWTTSTISYYDLLVMNRFQTSTVVMRREICQALGGFDRTVDGAEDWDFWLRASEMTQICKVDWPLVVYRDRPQGYSKDLFRVYRTMMPMLDKHRMQKQVTRQQFQTIEAWHHLRFAVGFALAKDYAHSGQALSNVFKRHLAWHAVPAMTQYLLPFLWQRKQKHSA